MLVSSVTQTSQPLQRAMHRLCELHGDTRQPKLTRYSPRTENALCKLRPARCAVVPVALGTQHRPIGQLRSTAQSSAALHWIAHPSQSGSALPSALYWLDCHSGACTALFLRDLDLQPTQKRPKRPKLQCLMNRRLIDCKNGCCPKG